MSFGFPAYHEEEYRYDCSRSDLMDAVLTGLHELHWESRDEGCWSISARRGISLWSWGETITIHVGPGPLLYIRSECRMPTQCFDWGRNADNVRCFLDCLDEILDEFARDDRHHSRDDHDSRIRSSSWQVSDRSGTQTSPSSARPRPGSRDDSIRQ